MTAAEANRRQAEILSNCVDHENNLMRPASGEKVCQDFKDRVLAFCQQYGVKVQ